MKNVIERESKECNGKKKKKVCKGRRGAPAKSFPDGNNWNRTLFKNDGKGEGERRERGRKVRGQRHLSQKWSFLKIPASYLFHP